MRKRYAEINNPAMNGGVLNPSQTIKACIFDLDGTLLDSSGGWEKIDLDFLQERGIAVPPDYMNAILPMTFQETAAYTIRRFGLPDSVESLTREWNDMAAHAYGHTVPMKPYAREYVTALRERGARLAVATGLPAKLYEPALNNHGIRDLFHAVCSTDEVGRGKSHPDVFLLAAKKLGVSPRECIVFDDILPALQTAKSIGMTVCGVYDKASEHDRERIKETADFAIPDFRTAPLF